jgi:hypothetical protein
MGAIGTSGRFAIYREQPILTVTLFDDTVVWGSGKWSSPLTASAVRYDLGGFVNGGDIDDAGITGQATLTIDGNLNPNSLNHGSYAVSFERNTLVSAMGYGIPAGPISRADGFVVTKRPITITANSVASVYGEPISLQYSVSPSTDVSGLRGSDQVPGSLAGVTSTSNVGEYDITQGSVAAPNGNYALTFVPGKYTVTQRPLRIVADSKSMVFGGNLPQLTYSYESESSGRGLLSVDQMSGALYVPAGSGSDIGTYPIVEKDDIMCIYSKWYRKL